MGISLTSAYPGIDGIDAVRWVVERGKAASQTRLANLSLGDHHVTGPMPYVQNVPALGRLLAAWDERPAGCLFLVPQWNPVLMAEQVGTLAALAEGPFIVQTGLGGRREVAAMGLDVPHRARWLEASIEAVKRLLAGERVDEPELGIADVAIAPVPPRDVEWWIGGESDAALDRAARLGDAWYAGPGLTPTAARERRERYLDACDRHGRMPLRVVIRKDVFVADDDKHAARIGRSLVDAGYRGMTADAVAFGMPEQVAEQLAVFADIGFTDVTVRTMQGVAQADALRSIELCDRVAELLADA